MAGDFTLSTAFFFSSSTSTAFFRDNLPQRNNFLQKQLLFDPSICRLFFLSCSNTCFKVGKGTSNFSEKQCFLYVGTFLIQSSLVSEKSVCSLRNKLKSMKFSKTTPNLSLFTYLFLLCLHLQAVLLPNLLKFVSFGLISFSTFSNLSDMDSQFSSVPTFSLCVILNA